MGTIKQLEIGAQLSGSREEIMRDSAAVQHRVQQGGVSFAGDSGAERIRPELTQSDPDIDPFSAWILPGSKDMIGSSGDQMINLSRVIHTGIERNSQNHKGSGSFLTCCEVKSVLWDTTSCMIKASKRNRSDEIKPEQKGGAQMEYRMISVNGHVEVLDRRGNFLFSADTEQEAWQDLRELSTGSMA